MISRHGDAEGRHSGIVTGADLYDLLAVAAPSLPESDKQRLVRFAVIGSRRANSSERAYDHDYEMGLVHVYHMDEKLGDVIQHMKNEATRTNMLDEDDDGGTMAQYRRQMAEEEKRRAK